MDQKVLFTASTYSHIRNFHLPYLHRFRAQGWQVHVACGGAPIDIPEADRVIHLPLEKRMASPKNFEAARLLHRQMVAEGYRLVSTHTSLAAFFTRLAVWGVSPRPLVVNTSHGYLFDDQSSSAKRALLLNAERLCAGRTDLLMTMNRYDYETAVRYGLGREIYGIPGMGVDFSRLVLPDPGAAAALRGEFGFGADRFLMIYAAEFSPRKSQETLIRALAHLPERAVLLLPGEGALRGQCMELARTLGLERRIIFPGHVGNMATWYAASDCALSSSRSEGLPFHLMEAMYLGLPIAASRVKGHVDLIRDGENGLLFSYGDADACAKAVHTLMEDVSLRTSLSQRAKEDAKSYSIETVLPIVMDCYAKLLPDLSPAVPV